MRLALGIRRVRKPRREEPGIESLKKLETLTQKKIMLQLFDFPINFFVGIPQKNPRD